MIVEQCKVFFRYTYPIAGRDPGVMLSVLCAPDRNPENEALRFMSVREPRLLRLVDLSSAECTEVARLPRWPDHVDRIFILSR